MTKYLMAAALLAVLGAGPRAQTTDDLGRAPRIAMADFKKLLASGEVFVIDVRGFESYKLGHVPGARSFPIDQLDLKLDELKEVTKPIVAYCA